MLLGLFLFIIGFWLYCMFLTEEGRLILALYLCIAVLLGIIYLIRNA